MRQRCGRALPRRAEDPGAKAPSPSPAPDAAQMRAELERVPEPPGGYKSLSEGQRSAVSGFFFPDAEELDMDKSMPLEDHVEEFRQGAFRAGICTIACVSVCLYFYKELTAVMEAPAQV